MINSLQKKRSHIQATCLCIFLICFQWMFAQDNLSYYNKIVDSNDKDSLKILAIENWISSIKNKTNSLELNSIYTEFSKFCYKNKEYTKAIINANSALEIQLKLIDTLPQFINNTYNNLYVFYQKSGDAFNALETLKKLVALPYKDKYTIIAYVNGLKDHALQRGDYYEALNHIQKAEQIILSHQDTSLKDEYYRIPIALSGVYIKLESENDYNKALVQLKKADSLNRYLLNFSKQKNNSIIVENRFGQVYSKLKKYDKAIHHFNKALEVSLDTKDSNFQTAILLNNIGVNYYKKGLKEKAYNYYKKALYYNPTYTAVYDNLGDYYLERDEFEKSLLHYQIGIDYNLKNYENHSIYKLGEKKRFEYADNKIELLNDLKDKSRAWLAYYKATKNEKYLINALTTIEMADYMVDLIRNESIEPQSRFFWRAKEIDLYLLASNISFELKNKEKAFYFMEKSKSLALLENLTHEEAKRRSNLPDSLINKEYQLKKNIFITRKKLEKDSSLSDADKLYYILNCKKTYTDFINSLEENFPNYYLYKKEIKISSYKDAANNARDTKSSFLQYILSDENGYGMLICPDNDYFFKIKDVPTLQKEIVTIGKLLNHYWETKENENSFDHISKSIYHKLIPPEFVTTDKGMQNLIIIPDHTLYYLPFEVLNSAGYNSSVPQYLIEDFNIGYTYSFSLQEQIMNKDNKAPYLFLGMAPVNFDNINLPELSLSLQKIKSFKQKFNADIYVKNDASKANFIKKSYDYKVLHLSSHANSLDDENPWIAFSDKKLTLNELYFIPNRADIVVLDACKTGIGELLPGEGVLSLTRGFFHSGAKSVISSLWNTNEKSSNEIINSFYSYLEKGFSKTESLQKAKLDFISSHQGSEKSPYYWAALILTGDVSPIQIDQEQNYNGIIMILLSFLSLLIIFWVKNKKITLS